MIWRARLSVANFARRRGKAHYYFRPVQITEEVARRRDEDFHIAIEGRLRILGDAPSGSALIQDEDTTGREDVGSADLAYYLIGSGGCKRDRS